MKTNENNSAITNVIQFIYDGGAFDDAKSNLIEIMQSMGYTELEINEKLEEFA